MGAGIAKTFRDRRPGLYDSYRERCRNGQFTLGGVYVYTPPVGPIVYNLATQQCTGPHADLDAIRTAVTVMLHLAAADGITEIGLPGSAPASMDLPGPTSPMSSRTSPGRARCDSSWCRCRTRTRWEHERRGRAHRVPARPTGRRRTSSGHDRQPRAGPRRAARPHAGHGVDVPRAVRQRVRRPLRRQVRADIKTKRRILDWLADCYAKTLDGNWWTLEVVDALKAMAQPYAGRPGFRPEWAVTE